ncbi:hypothetical protein OF83DRAFT_166491 [Amylostereum chailletii]|nr:hypothetical protein OF83DRAFT_166491 [Amylostereum chailletii]
MEDAAIPEPSCSIRPPTPILRDAEEGRLAYDKGPFHASEKPASAAGSRQAVKLHPIHQLEVARYARGYNVRDGKNVFNGLIPAFREEYVHEQLEIGWRRVMHVEGTVYFVHEERGMCTEADVSNPAVLSQIYDAIDLVDDLYAEAGKARSRYHEVVFERWEDEDSDSEVAWGYYIADHEHRILFWAQEQSAYVLMREQIFVSDVQIGHALKSAYWDHITLYPRPLPWECINDVYSFATLCIGDAVFAPGETLCPYSLKHLESILNIMDRSRFVVVVAQALSMREHTRFLHYHGEPGARLTFGQSVYGPPFRKRHTIVFWTLSVFLWGKPLQSLHQLERAFVDEVLTLPYWSNFISTEVTRWTNIATQCMILGAANIAFLAIPTVIPSEDTDRLDHWTWAQLLSFWSSATLLIAITTTVIGRNYYSSLDGSDSDAAPVIDFLHSQKIRRGLLMKEFESLAVWHSLPLGCLLWGTLRNTLSPDRPCLLTVANTGRFSPRHPSQVGASTPHAQARSSWPYCGRFPGVCWS